MTGIAATYEATLSSSLSVSVPVSSHRGMSRTTVILRISCGLGRFGGMNKFRDSCLFVLFGGVIAAASRLAFHRIASRILGALAFMGTCMALIGVMGTLVASVLIGGPLLLWFDLRRFVASLLDQ